MKLEIQYLKALSIKPVNRMHHYEQIVNALPYNLKNKRQKHFFFTKYTLNCSKVTVKTCMILYHFYLKKLLF